MDTGQLLGILHGYWTNVRNYASSFIRNFACWSHLGVLPTPRHKRAQKGVPMTVKIVQLKKLKVAKAKEKKVGSVKEVQKKSSKDFLIFLVFFSILHQFTALEGADGDLDNVGQGRIANIASKSTKLT